MMLGRAFLALMILFSQFDSQAIAEAFGWNDQSVQQAAQGGANANIPHIHLFEH